MATPEINENCHYVQNDPHRCKIKLENFISTSHAVSELLGKSPGGGGIRPPQVR